MRRIVNRLVGRSFRLSTLRRLVQSSFTRLETLKTHRHVRYSEDRNDVVRLLQDSLPKLALSRCEQMIKHQNLLDAYGMIEGYLNVLTERINLIGHGRECPDELKEAVASLVFAASRCKDFPELEDIKSVFASRFDEDFTAGAVELRNNNTVNHSIMQKLSTKKPDKESTMNLLRAIASENHIHLQLNHKGELSNSIQTRQPNGGVALATTSYRTRSSTRKRRC